MGASLVYLTEPNKDIESEKGENDFLAWAAGNMQGWRLNMVSHSLYNQFKYHQLYYLIQSIVYESINFLHEPN